MDSRWEINEAQLKGGARTGDEEEEEKNTTNVKYFFCCCNTGFVARDGTT